MPDLLSHSLAAYVVRARPSTSRRAILLFVAGTVLPDVASQVPTLGLRTLGRVTGLDLPLWFFDSFQMFHSPLPLALFCWLLALFVPSSRRREAFLAFVGGGWLHLAFDMLQRHVSPVTYFPLYPFSGVSWELGLFSTEASLYGIPVLLVIAGGVAWRRHGAPGVGSAATERRPKDEPGSERESLGGARER